MTHDARYCGLCKLSDDDQRFATHLFVWSEPALNINEDFGLDVGCAERHFAAIDDGAFLRRRKNLECDPNWPLFENACALFVPTGPTSVSARLKRLAQRLEGFSDDEDTDGFLRIVSTAAKSFAGERLADLTDTGPRYFDGYATAGRAARAYADCFDFSAMGSADKRKILGTAQNYLPSDERIAKKIRKYGNAAVTVGMICRSAVRVDSGMYFSRQSVDRYFESQLWKWIAFRLLPEMFVPMLRGSKPSHRDFFVLSLDDLTEKAGEYWPGSPADAARKSLEHRLRRVIRVPQEKQAFFEPLWDEIPIGIASRLAKQRFKIKTADELIEALQAGELGLVWNETHDRLVDFIRKEGIYGPEEEGPKNKLLRPILVELDELTAKGLEPKHPTASADILVRQQDLQRLVAKAFALLDELDRFIAVQVLQFRLFGGKRPKNSEIAKEWGSTNGRGITGQAIGLRRNKVELLICSALMDKSVRKAAHL